MNFRISLKVVLAAAAALCCGSTCSLPWSVKGQEEILLAAYNVHNLFDDVEDGTEYAEFRPGSPTWNSSLYARRLELTADAIGSIYPERENGPDILCLTEIENAKVLADLATGHLKDGHYSWAFVGGPPDSPIRCGILSRLPIVTAKVHGVSGSAGGGRDMLEASFEIGGDRSGAGELLTVMLCHWKSRLGGARETEEARRTASTLVASRLGEILKADPGRLILVCGDFNESPDEFERACRAYPTAFMPPVRAAKPSEPAPPEAWFRGVLKVSPAREEASCEPGQLVLFSPWEEAGGWSYRFRDERDRLDGFLVSGTLLDGEGFEFLDFKVADDPELLDEDGLPFVWNGAAGYSDHLPIALRLGKKGR
jgi:endonuclease/exonuclease/phosphatase family metal-dependent hydrolase